MSRLLVTGIVVLMATTIPISAEAQDTSAEPRWGMSALVLVQKIDRGGGPTPIWAGLKNESSTARLLCVAGWDAAVHTPELNEGNGEGVSPHACREVTGYVVVLPGETLFKVIPFELRRATATPLSRLSVTLTFFEWAPSDPRRHREQVAMSWAGSLADAHALGTRVLAMQGKDRP